MLNLHRAWCRTIFLDSFRLLSFYLCRILHRLKRVRTRKRRLRVDLQTDFPLKFQNRKPKDRSEFDIFSRNSDEFQSKRLV